MSKTATAANELYFVTLTVAYWIDIFTRREYSDFIVDNLSFCQKNKNLEIYEYVIMTNHLHMICRGNDTPLSDILRDFKTFTSKGLFKLIKENPKESRKKWMIPLFKKATNNGSQNKNFKIWRNRNWPTLLFNNEIIDQKTIYIHMNPVKAGFVREPHEYFYSSANPEGPLKTFEF